MWHQLRQEALLQTLKLNALLRSEMHEVRVAIEAKHNPNWRVEPRAPKGTSEGGQWIGSGSSKPSRAPKQSRPRTDADRPEQPKQFFDPIDDNPYFWRLAERGLLPVSPTVADFYNLRFRLMPLRGPEFAEVARRHGMTSGELGVSLNYGSNVMSERAIDAINGLLSDPGIGGLNIVIREQRFNDYLAHSGIRQEYRAQMFGEILALAGYTTSEYEQRKLDIGIALQFPFLLGGGGPASTTTALARVVGRLRNPDYVWNLGSVTRGRVIEAALGHNLPANFRVIDRFTSDGLATSIKSVDLGASTYLRTETLHRLIRGQIDRVAGFRGATFAGRTIREQEITHRALDLVVPHTGTPAQQHVIDAAIQYGRSRGVTVNVIVYP